MIKYLAVNGWKIKNWFDWMFAMASFAIFLTLEATIVYSYWVMLRGLGFH